MGVTREIACFAKETQYKDLPSPVVKETKRLLLDTIGCAIGGIGTQKGELAIRIARSLGGPAEASLLGTRDKVSVASSAFATGELMNALDSEALLSPPEHATPYVLAALLSIGEMKKVSGRECILATAVAHELATRMGSSLILENSSSVELPDKGVRMSLPIPGFGLCAFGGVASAGRLWGLSAEKIAHAMGIVGYSVPVPMITKFATTVPASMPKYLSAGVLSQGEVLAVISADMGCTGDTEVLEGDYGFWRAFGCDGWRPERITEGLGESWHFPERIFYKSFPCCGAMQNTLAHFCNIVREQDLRPEDIQELTVKLNLLAELPVWRTTHIENHIDAQFSVPFVFSVAAHRIDVGPSWQAPETLRDQRISEFMKKVRVITELDPDAQAKPDVEVVVGTGANRKAYSKRGFALVHQMTDGELIEKFRGNTRSILDKGQVQKAVEAIQTLEELDDISELFGFFSPV